MISENRTSSKELSNQLENKMWKWGLRSFVFFSRFCFIFDEKKNAIRCSTEKMCTRYTKNAFNEVKTVRFAFFGFFLKINHLAEFNIVSGWNRQICTGNFMHCSYILWHTFGEPVIKFIHTLKNVALDFKFNL